MPRRQEGLFWVRAEQVNASIALEVDAANQQFVSEWKESPLSLHWCTEGSTTPDQLWLLRLNHSGSKELPKSLCKGLRVHIAENAERLQAKLKRPANLPTPLVCPRLEEWVTDLGLHAVNDIYNSTLMTFTYYEGRYYNPPHFQFVHLRRLVSLIEELWLSVKCDCGDGSCGECGATGCFNCFKLDCMQCHGTGWRHFASWATNGYKVDYSSGFPLAEFGKEPQAALGAGPAFR
jgi:hypothetical protein